MALASTVFTHENAVEMAKRSWSPESARFAPKVSTADRAQLAAQSKEALRVRTRINQIDKAMGDALTHREVECPHCKQSVRVGADGRELDALSRARDRLFKEWMVWTGTPGSGQRKPPAQRSPRQVQAGPGFSVPEVLPDPPDPATQNTAQEQVQGGTVPETGIKASALPHPTGLTPG